MKKLLFVLMAIVSVVPLFADFEFQYGIYGGLGNTASAGFNMRIGYMSPSFKDTAGGEENKFKWSILTDLGIGFRYGLIKEPYRYEELSYSGEIITQESPYSNFLDYNMGLLAEFYFFRFSGIALGGGVAPGAISQHFVPYARIELPLLFDNGRVSLGFDYILWTNNEFLPGAKMPPGYRVNLLLHLRGLAALDLLLFLF